MIEYYPGVDGQWYWRYCAKNGQISAIAGEGYKTKSNAKRAARRIGIAMSFAQTKEVKE